LWIAFWQVHCLAKGSLVDIAVTVLGSVQGAAGDRELKVPLASSLSEAAFYLDILLFSNSNLSRGWHHTAPSHLEHSIFKGAIEKRPSLEFQG
jgi:hypothetical protein